MRIFLVRISVVALLGIVICSVALSAGFQLNEHGARAVGIGGAFVAQASDPSAIYFNPAGLAFQQGNNVYAGGTFIMPTHSYKNPTSGTETSTDYQLFFTPNVYGTYAINNDLVVGLGVFVPYGLGTRWPSGWDGKYQAINTQIETFYVNPSVAYKISDQLAVGFGISYVYGSVDLSRNVSPTSLFSMSATGHNWGFNAGVLYKPLDNLSIGASFRSLTKLNVSGDVQFGSISGISGNATVPLPENIYLGAAYQFSPALTVEADIQFVGWSAYDVLTTYITNIPAIYSSIIPSSSSSVNNWDDTYIGRVGAEYKLNTAWTLRGGLAYDMTPSPRSTMGPMMPDADRIDVSVGGGYKINEHLYVDAAYMIGLFSERTSTLSGFSGAYNSTFSVISMNIGYSF